MPTRPFCFTTDLCYTECYVSKKEVELQYNIELERINTFCKLYNGSLEYKKNLIARLDSYKAEALERLSKKKWWQLW